MDLNQKSKVNNTLPSNAKLAFKGIIFDIYQWEQKQFDGSIKTFEIASRPDSIFTIPVTKEGKIIVTKQIQPGWSKALYKMPGGMVEKGEVFLSAIKRELLEETGYKAQNHIYWFHSDLGAKVDRRSIWTIARDCKHISAATPDKGGEQIELLFVSFEEFVKLVFDKDFKDRELQPLFLEAQLNNKKMLQIRNLLGL